MTDEEKLFGVDRTRQDTQGLEIQAEAIREKPVSSDQSQPLLQPDVAALSQLNRNAYLRNLSIQARRAREKFPQQLPGLITLADLDAHDIGESIERVSAQACEAGLWDRLKEVDLLWSMDKALVRNLYDIDTTGSVQGGRRLINLATPKLSDLGERLKAILVDHPSLDSAEAVAEVLEKPHHLRGGSSDRDAMALKKFLGEVKLELAGSIAPDSPKAHNAENPQRNLTLLDAALRLEERAEAVAVLASIEDESSNTEDYDSPAGELRGELLDRQLQLRKRYIEAAFPGMEQRVARLVASPTLEAAMDPKGQFGEHHVIYAGLIYSPSWSTKRFIGEVRKVWEDARSAEMVDRAAEVFAQGDHPVNGMGDLDERVAVLSLLRSLSGSAEGRVESGINVRGTFDGWKGKHVWEIGGSEAAQALENLGAEQVRPADAGHSGYSYGYAAGDVSKMVSLANWREYAESHIAHAVLFSRILEAGTGVAQISESTVNADDHGITELLMVAANALEEGGVVLVDNGIVEPDQMQLGYSLESWIQYPGPGGGAHVYRSGTPEGGGFVQLGRKAARYNPENSIWS